MALSKSTLETEFRKLMDPDFAQFAGFPDDGPAAAANFANAYDLYASNAADASGDLVASKNKAGFESALAGVISPNTPAAAMGAAFEQAFVMYWTGAVFAVGIPPPNGVGGTGLFSVELTSMVVTVTPGVLLASIVPELSSTSDDGAAKAAAFADLFHTATTSAVIVLITGLDTTPPPAGPLPITNTGPLQ